jgi:hypothetical protein
MSPTAFLTALWQHKPEEMYILIWTGQDKRSYWFQDVAAAGDFAGSDACRNKCVFVGIGLSRTDNGPNRRCTSVEIACICGIWADFDLKCDAHKNKALPAAVAEAEAILPQYMPPTITVATGNGVHAWWLLKEPLVFETEEERRHASSVVNRWHTMLRFDCAARGWAYDRLSDFARVARVAGTRNMKDAANPKDVRVLSADESRRYNLSDFEEFLDDAVIPDTKPEEQAREKLRDRINGAPLSIDLSARIPRDVLDGWMSHDARFRNTWERRRHDLKDSSQSGYDLALADFGVEAGLPEQQIVDLIVHHRAIHGQMQRTRLDYYQRTIAKALSQSSNTARPAQATELAAATPTGGEPAPAGTTDQPAGAAAEFPAKQLSPERARAKLCGEISAEIGIPIQITKFVRITGKDPSFRMELADDSKIDFSHTGKFVDQDAVRLALAGQKKWLMAPIKSAKWREIAQKMLDACFDEEGPIEAQWEDGTRATVAKYLEHSSFIEDISSAHPDYRTKPIVIGGRIAINTTDLRAWIFKTTGDNHSVQRLASNLSAMGAEPKRVASKHYDQSRWILPTKQFAPGDYQKASQQTEVTDAPE